MRNSKLMASAHVISLPFHFQSLARFQAHHVGPTVAAIPMEELASEYAWTSKTSVGAGVGLGGGFDERMACHHARSCPME